MRFEKLKQLLKDLGEYKVKKFFSCFNNELISLEGCPIEVGGSFTCSDNKLTSLEGSPKEVGAFFNCEHNVKQFTDKEVREVCNVKNRIYT